jgi:hypothetical protein
MTVENEFESSGIEQLSRDFSELAISLVSRRDANLDNTSLDRLLVTFEVMSVAIEHEKEIRATRLDDARLFEERIFGVIVEKFELPVIDRAIEEGLFVDQLDANSEDQATDTEATEEDSSTVEIAPSLDLSKAVEAQQQTDETALDESPKSEDAETLTDKARKPKVLESKDQVESRSVDWDEVEAILKIVVTGFEVGDELKAAAFFNHPYFKNMIGDDRKGLSKAKSRLKIGIDRLVDNGVLKHNGKIKSQSAYVLVNIPDITENDKTFLSQ